MSCVLFLPLMLLITFPNVRNHFFHGCICEHFLSVEKKCAHLLDSLLSKPENFAFSFPLPECSNYVLKHASIALSSVIIYCMRAFSFSI